MKRIRNNTQGMILISAYLALSLIGTFSYVVFTKNLALYRESERTTNRIIAFHLAESGLDQAIVQLRNNRSYTGQGYTAFTRGGYDIQVETPNPLTNPTTRRITTNGHTPNNLPASYAYERRQVLAYVNLTRRSPFNFSIFANDRIELEGNAATDSYDSRNGPYSPSTARSNGSIGTNGVSSGIVEVEGNARVKGNAVVGPEADVTQAIKIEGNGRIDGTRSAATAPMALDPVQIPTSLTNQGSLRATGNDTMTLAGGTYLFSTIKIDGNGRVNFTGSATIYVTGKVEVSGNGMGTAQNLPPNLMIKVQGGHGEEEGDAKVKISENASFFGAIYAPNCKVKVSGHANIYGAIVGNTIKESGNGKVHYDEALNQPSGGSSNTSTLLAWTEV